MKERFRNPLPWYCLVHQQRTGMETCLIRAYSKWPEDLESQDEGEMIRLAGHEMCGPMRLGRHQKS